MNQIIIAASLSFFAISQAVADSGGVADSGKAKYFGVKFGPSNVVDGSNGYGLFYNYVVFVPNTFNQNELLSKLSIAAEVEYVDLGRSRRNYYFAQVANHKASTYGVVGTASYPINQFVSVLAKVGLASVTRRYQCVVAGCGVDYSTTALGWHTGVAVQYQLTPQMTLGVGYDYYPDGYKMMSGIIATNF